MIVEKEPFLIVLEPFLIVLEPFLIILEPFLIILEPSLQLYFYTHIMIRKQMILYKEY
jgi:hypothetical protein